MTFRSNEKGLEICMHSALSPYPSPSKHPRGRRLGILVRGADIKGHLVIASV